MIQQQAEMTERFHDILSDQRGFPRDRDDGPTGVLSQRSDAQEWRLLSLQESPPHFRISQTAARPASARGPYDDDKVRRAAGALAPSSLPYRARALPIPSRLSARLRNAASPLVADWDGHATGVA